MPPKLCIAAKHNRRNNISLATMQKLENVADVSNCFKASLAVEQKPQKLAKRREVLALVRKKELDTTESESLRKLRCRNLASKHLDCLLAQLRANPLSTLEAQR